MKAMESLLALRIDIDTYWGCRDGVPALARLLEQLDAHATFFVVTGRDSSGRHLARLKQPGYARRLSNPGVLRALLRLPLRSFLYGTLLPGPLVAGSNRMLLRGLTRDGRELGLHGSRHAFWAERWQELSAETAIAEWRRGSEGFVEALGFEAQAHAAPNWRMSARALRALDSLPLAYRSDTRGRSPFWPLVDGERLRTLQIPVTLPRLDCGPARYHNPP
jgi:undecaprenyl phosphate-alpha-L-ara4FN deformylase